MYIIFKNILHNFVNGVTLICFPILSLWFGYLNKVCYSFFLFGAESFFGWDVVDIWFCLGVRGICVLKVGSQRHVSPLSLDCLHISWDCVSLVCPIRILVTMVSSCCVRLISWSSHFLVDGFICLSLLFLLPSLFFSSFLPQIIL